MESNWELIKAAYDYFNPFFKPRLVGKIKNGATKSDLRFVVYLPAGYNENDMTKYPVLYHLHGATEYYVMMKREVEWTAAEFEKWNPDTPIIIVAPYDPTEWSWWIDGDKIQMFTLIHEELIPQIESTYKVRTDRDSRFIQGFSMGGFGAVVHGFKYQDMFSKIIIWDGAMHDYETIITFTVDPPYCREQFGASKKNQDVFDREKWDKWDPFLLIKASKEAGRMQETPMLMWSKSTGFLPEYCKSFEKAVEELGGNIKYEPNHFIHSYKPFIQTHGREAVQFYTNKVKR